MTGKAAKLKEIEEKRLAIEMERKKREQEMADLLAEQERLKKALGWSNELLLV